MDTKLPDKVVTIRPSGVYSRDKDLKLRDNLVTALERAVDEIAECKDVVKKVDCPNPMVYCPGLFP